MGLLDDAIKEHLELKRRSGADAAEISKLETEALGPVRRSADGVPDLPDSFDAPQDPATAPQPAPASRPWEDDEPTSGRLPDSAAPADLQP
ncbi:MAG: hypothetical protein ACRDMZ_23200, partial [Solirubrobacteraceae bacterium]